MGNQWVILWTASVSLLRTVGHVLRNVDAATDLRMRSAVDDAWNKWSTHKDEHRIFWEFIEEARNSILKEFDLQAGQGVIVRPGGDHTVTYPIYLDGFGEADQLELLDTALEWWHVELERIESHSAI